jgi:hypothetical protein
MKIEVDTSQIERHLASILETQERIMTAVSGNVKLTPLGN